MADYTYIKDIQIEDDRVIPVGHYSIATWSSSAPANSHKFQVEDGDEASSFTMNIELVTENQSATLIIPVVDATPGNYKMYTESMNLLSTTVMYSRENSAYSVTLPDGIQGNIYVTIRCNNAPNISSYVSEVTGTTLTRVSAVNLLTESVDYGDTLPDAGVSGRVFFVKVQD